MHIVRGLTNGTTYRFQVRALNSSAVGGLESNAELAVPSIPPGAPTLTATAGDDEVRLTWTPAADGGRRILKYECQGWDRRRSIYTPCDDGTILLGTSATSLTLTEDDVHPIRNDRTYTFQVRAVNDRENTVGGGDRR